MVIDGRHRGNREVSRQPGARESTRRAYRVDVEEFAAWLEARGTPLDDVDVRALAAYVADLGASRPGRHPRRLAPATIARKLAAVRAFLRFTLGPARVPDARLAPRRPRRLPAAPQARRGRHGVRTARLRRPARNPEPRARRADLLGGTAEPRGRRPRPRRRGLRQRIRPRARQGRQGASRPARRGGRLLAGPLAPGPAEPGGAAPRTRSSSRRAAGASTRAPCVGCCRIRTASATRSRPTSSRAAPTCGRSRSSSATARSRPPRSTATSTRDGSAASMTAPTRDPELEALSRALGREARAADRRGLPPRPEGARRLARPFARDGDDRGARALDRRAREPPASPPATIARRVASVRSFFRHLVLVGSAHVNPAAELELPRRIRRLPRTLSPGEAERLIDAAAGTTPRALRDRALVELLYGAGLRVSEAVGARPGGRRPRAAARPHRRQGRQGARRSARPPGRRGAAPLPRAGAAAPRPAPPPGALPQRPGRRAHARRRVPDPAPARREGRPRAGARPPAPASPLVRDPPTRGRRRPEKRSGDARPCRSRHDRALHARNRSAAPGVVLPGAPTRAPTTAMNDVHTGNHAAPGLDDGRRLPDAEGRAPEEGARVERPPPHVRRLRQAASRPQRLQLRVG